jgi:hypothetical protein
MTPTELTLEADSRLYTAKRLGRNRIQGDAGPQDALSPKFTVQGS